MIYPWCGGIKIIIDHFSLYCKKYSLQKKNDCAILYEIHRSEVLNRWEESVIKEKAGKETLTYGPRQEEGVTD